MEKPVALATGVGPGTGSAMVRRFAPGGYAVAMLARTRERKKRDGIAQVGDQGNNVQAEGGPNVG